MYEISMAKKLHKKDEKEKRKCSEICLQREQKKKMKNEKKKNHFSLEIKKILFRELKGFSIGLSIIINFIWRRKIILPS